MGEEFEGLRDARGILPFAAHAAAELVVVHFAAADGLDAGDNSIALFGPIVHEPIFENRPHGPGKPEHLPAGADGPRFCACLQDRGNFHIGEARNDRRHHHAHRHAGGG